MSEVNLSPHNLKYTYWEKPPIEKADHEIPIPTEPIPTGIPFAPTYPPTPAPLLQPLLPQREDWTKHSLTYPSFNVAVGDDEDIWSFTEENGWLIYVMIKSDSPDVSLVIQTGTAIEEMKISDAHLYGYDNSNAGVPFWVSKYSATDGYVLNFTPRPEQPYKEIIKISVKNNGTSTAAISVAKMIRVETYENS